MRTHIAPGSRGDYDRGTMNITSTSRSLPLPADPTSPSPPPARPNTAELSEIDSDWNEGEVTRTTPHRTLDNLLQELSSVESLAVAAELALRELDHGPTSELARKRRRVADLVATIRGTAARALESGERLQAEID